MTRSPSPVTNPAIVTEAIARRAGTAALIKLYQIGTVTEALETMRIGRQAGWAPMVSHRSGETEDAFIAGLATGTGCGQLMTGAPARGDASSNTTGSSTSKQHTNCPTAC